MEGFHFFTLGLEVFAFLGCVFVYFCDLLVFFSEVASWLI
jgi:hypothetical protein